MQKQQNGPLKWAWCEPSRWDAFNDGVNHQRKDEESTKLKLRSRSVEIQHLHTNIPTVLPCEPSPWTHRDRGPNVRYRSCQWTHRHCWVKFVWNVAVEPQTQTISGFRFRSFIWCRLSSRVNLCWFHLFLLGLRLFHVCFCREKIQLNAAFEKRPNCDFLHPRTFSPSACCSEVNVAVSVNPNRKLDQPISWLTFSTVDPNIRQPPNYQKPSVLPAAARGKDFF